MSVLEPLLMEPLMYPQHRLEVSQLEPLMEHLAALMEHPLLQEAELLALALQLSEAQASALMEPLDHHQLEPLALPLMALLLAQPDSLLALQLMELLLVQLESLVVQLMAFLLAQQLEE